MAQGSRGHIGIKKEVTWGQREVTNNDCFLPFVSESLTTNIEEVMSAIQRGILDEPKSYQGEKSFAGDIVVEVHPVSIGHILRSALGVPKAATLAGATEKELENCEDAWDEAAGVNTGVISGVDANDKKKGSYAVKLIVTAGVAPGILATEQVTLADMKADTALKVWIKCDVACDAGHLALMISEVAGCGGTEHDTLKIVPIPTLVAGVWKECTIPLGYINRSDIAFVNGDTGVDTITTVAGDFVAAGFVVGDKIKVTGSTSNNVEGKELTVVEVGTLTMATGSLNESEDAGDDVTITSMDSFDAIISVGIKMVTDKAECTIHIDDLRRVGAYTATAAKQHIFTPMQSITEEFHADCPLFPYTLEVYRDQGKAFQFLGAVVNTLALNFSTTDKILKATCGIIAKNLDSKTVEPTGLSLEPTNPFVWENARIKIGAVGAQDPINTDLESFGVTWDNLCVAKYALNNTAFPRKIIRDGVRTIPVSFVIDFVNRTEYDNFIDGNERAFQVKFEGAVIAGETTVKYTLQIDMPLVRYLAYPINIGGPGRLSCAVTGKAKYDAAGYALKITLFNEKDTSEYQKETA